MCRSLPKTFQKTIKLLTAMPDITQNVGRLSYDIITFLIALIGISFNALGIIFLVYSKVKHAFLVFLTSLMITDLLYLITVLLQCILAFLSLSNLNSVFTELYHIAIILKRIRITLFSISGFTITCMSLERLSRVCFPLRSQPHNSRKCAFFLIVAGIIINIAGVIPHFVLSETPRSNDTTTLLTPTVMKWRGEDSETKRKIYITVLIAVTRILPAAIAFVSNVYLIIILIHRRPRRAFLFANRERRSERSRFDEFGTTWTLIIISSFLLFSLVPSAIAQMLASLYPNIYLDKNYAQYRYYTITINFGRFVSMLCAANDFVVYILMSRRSRMTFKHVFRERMCQCFRRRRAGQRSRVNIEETQL